jgi:hypothetical protein
MSPLNLNQIRALGELDEARRAFDEDVPAIVEPARRARLYAACVMAGELGIDRAQVDVVLDGVEPAWPASAGLDERNILDLAYRFAGVDR